jgi:hypothetical protein
MNRFLLAAAAVVVSTSAPAQPPDRGWIGTFFVPSILCDTEEQLRSIGQALDESKEAFRARFTEFNEMRISRVFGTAGEKYELGHMRLGRQVFYGWGVPVQNERGKGHFLFLEPVTQKIKNSI